jgi:hypothetical protein
MSQECERGPGQFHSIKSSTISSTHFTKDLTEQLRHSGCHHLSSVLGYKDNMGVHVINHMSSGAEVHMSHIIYNTPRLLIAVV